MNLQAGKIKPFSLVALLLLLVSVSTASLRAEQLELPFPETPELDMTPGTLCIHPDSYRYPEKIPYCNRDVDSSTKYDIIDAYDRQYGYKIRASGRSSFKIDHFIPLCMGGSNEVSNLWPQHRSVYDLTDPLEPELCNRMASGRMNQVEAIAIIRRAKADPKLAPGIYDELVGNGRGRH